MTSRRKPCSLVAFRSPLPRLRVPSGFRGMRVAVIGHLFRPALPERTPVAGAPARSGLDPRVRPDGFSQPVRLVLLVVLYEAWFDPPPRTVRNCFRFSGVWVGFAVQAFGFPLGPFRSARIFLFARLNPLVSKVAVPVSQEWYPVPQLRSSCVPVYHSVSRSVSGSPFPVREFPRSPGSFPRSLSDLQMRFAAVQAFRFRFPGWFRFSVGLPGFPLTFPASRRCSRYSAPVSSSSFPVTPPGFPGFVSGCASPFSGSASREILFRDFHFQVSPWQSSFPRAFCSTVRVSGFPLGLSRFPEGSGFRLCVLSSRVSPFAADN